MHRSVDGGDYTTLYNIINNYYKPGPVTPKDKSVGHRILKPESGRSNSGDQVYGRAYVHGNIVEGHEQVTRDNWAGGVQIEDMPGVGDYLDLIRVNKPFPIISVQIVFIPVRYCDYLLLIPNTY